VEGPARGLQQVTAALNVHHISKASSSSSSPGCAGGFQIVIAIVPQHSAPVQLNAYHCANQTTGNIGGDLVGFLSSIGFSV
jgi:hypothetical protein